MSTLSGSARLDARGRVVLPAALRRRLGMRPGDDLMISEEAEGVLRLESRSAAARGLIGLAGSVADRSMVEELRVDRRHEAAREQADPRRQPE